MIVAGAGQFFLNDAKLRFRLQMLVDQNLIQRLNSSILHNIKFPGSENKKKVQNVNLLKSLNLTHNQNKLA